MAPMIIKIDSGITGNDVIAELLLQHQEIRVAIDAVANTTTPESRQQAFDALRELFLRHEAAEAKIRPLTRSIDGGEEIADQRLKEENESKLLLAKLDTLNTVSVRFARTFEKFAVSVLAHSQAEEKTEFPLLRRRVAPSLLTVT